MAIVVEKIMQAENHLSIGGFISMLITGRILSPLKGWKIPFVIFVAISGLWFFLLIFIAVTLLLWPLLKATPQVIHYKYFMKKRMEDEANRAFTKFIGKEVKFKDTSLGFSNSADGKICGYGLAYSDSTVYVMEHGLAAKIPWSEIRKWSWNVDGYSVTSVYGGSLANNAAANMTATINNAKAKWDAYMESGFFITVADIEYPKWQYMTDDKKVLSRWMEIFNQVNEGKI